VRLPEEQSRGSTRSLRIEEEERHAVVLLEDSEPRSTSEPAARSVYCR